MVSDLSKQAHLTAPEKVTQALRRDITTGVLPAGAQLRQAEIAAQYKVSRMPVREALRQLEAEGLIVLYPGRGAFVNRLTAAEIEEIYEIRILLESHALQQAFPALSPLILTQAEAFLEEFEVAEDGLTFGKLDEAFHRAIYAPAQRPRLLNLISTLRNQVTRFLYIASPMDVYRDRALQEHRQILEACQSGELKAAVEALERHLHNSAKMIIASNS